MTGCWTSRMRRRRARLLSRGSGSNEYSTSMRRLRRESTRVIAIIVKCLWFHVKPVAVRKYEGHCNHRQVSLVPRQVSLVPHQAG